MEKYAISTLLTILHLLMIICVNTKSLNSSTDEHALLAFKAQITSDPSNLLAKNWSRGTSFCNWIGVTCGTRHRRVRVLNLSNMGLIGSIPIKIGNLSKLKNLNLSENNLTGALPSSIFNISSLVELRLRGNKISGEFPKDPCRKPAKLEVLDLGSNSFHGQIPSTLLQCCALKELSLSSNGFTGSIPNGIEKLSALQWLTLDKNRFTGSIPYGIGNLSSLQYLYLGSNMLTGSIPHEIGNLSSLQYLFLDSNMLAGTVPHSIGSLSNMKYFDVYNNSVHGHIPEELGQLSNLEWIVLSRNKIEGKIPNSIFNLTKIQALALAHNNISGNLPSSIPNELLNLQGLYLSKNRLSGEIPSYVSNFSKLTMLNLDYNLFTGRVPMDLGNLRNLERLYLDNNQLTNDRSMAELDFLISLKKCGQLKYLVISNNLFDGTLPKDFGNLSASLQVFYVDSCGIKGVIPSEIGSMTNLIWLGMGDNELIGTIPQTLSQLTNLQMLDLRENKLQGSIPYNFCNLTNLFYLDLGISKLSQPLPTCLGDLTSLRQLHLDSNSFTSKIPSTMWTNKDIEVVNLSHNFLNGSLDTEIGNIKAMTVLDLSSNQFSGEIPSTIGELDSLLYLLLSNNRLHSSIPESFGNLISLRYLDLSKNNLYGEIPLSMEKLKDLEYFNVSFNDLSGEIPNTGPFKNLTADLFTGNSKLCGDLQFGVARCKANSTSAVRKSGLLKYILPPVALVTILVATLVYLIRSRNRKILLPDQSTSLDLISRVSYYEVLNATNKFAEESIIGRGSTGSVYKGIFSDGTIAAIKIFNLDLERSDESFHTECQMLCKIRHRNLVKVISSCSNLDLKALVLEYMPNGDLNKWLSSANCNLNIAQRLEMMIDVACALEYLHHGYTSPIVHCDLKPSNILLDEDMVAHISDFGIAKLFTEEQRISLTKTLGTLGYMAPEYGSTGLISTMADVYSYGILLMETFTRKKPTDDMFVEEFTLRRWVFESFTDGITQIVDVDLVNAVEDDIRAIENCFISIMELALECTTNLPEERLDMKDVLTWLRKIKFEFCK